MKKENIEIKIRELENKHKANKGYYASDLYELGLLEGQLSAYRAVLRHFKEWKE